MNKKQDDQWEHHELREQQRSRYEGNARNRRGRIRVTPLVNRRSASEILRELRQKTTKAKVQTNEISGIFSWIIVIIITLICIALFIVLL